MKRLLWIAGGVVVLLATVVAAAQDVQTNYDRNYRLGQLKTFGIATHQRGGNDALASDPITDKRIADALRKELIAAGMQESDHPQFWVTYYASLKDQADIRSTGWGRPYWGMGEIRTDHYTVGTLVVDFIEAKNEHHVWRGMVSDTLEPNRKHDKLEKAVGKLVRKYLADVEKQNKGK